MYFFDELIDDGSGTIRYSQLIVGNRQDPKLFSKHINGGKSFHPYIAPDEYYLIFHIIREGGNGDTDIYISFKQTDGSWETTLKLGDKINTGTLEVTASETPNGKYLFFN
ncbi:MAG: hypothetical protein K0U54_03150 [Bacteroidetes bacterium]|nr:hypothetical protein [Bacteroidota bacterium]